MLYMWHCAHIILRACWIYDAMCICCFTHVGAMVLCTSGAMYILYMQCYVDMVFCSFCTCGDIYILC